MANNRGKITTKVKDSKVKEADNNKVDRRLILGIRMVALVHLLTAKGEGEANNQMGKVDNKVEVRAKDKDRVSYLTDKAREVRQPVGLQMVKVDYL